MNRGTGEGEFELNCIWKQGLPIRAGGISSPRAERDRGDTIKEKEFA